MSVPKSRVISQFPELRRYKLSQTMSSGFCLKLVSFLQNAATHPLATYPIAEGRGPNPFGRFRHVTAIPEGAHAGSALVGDERPSSTVHLASCLYLTAESDSAEFSSNPDGPNARTLRPIRQVPIWQVPGIWPAVNNRAWAALGQTADESPPPTAARFAADPPID